MTINIVCTSKPVDGLLYYSYEYASYLNSAGIPARTVIVCYPGFSRLDYIQAINQKYVDCKNVSFGNFKILDSDVTLVMGRSMITLSWLNFKNYSVYERELLKTVFSGNVISVYSENHMIEYPKALNFYSPKNVIDICDTDVYPNGVGEHFEKRINFDIYKPFDTDIKFKYLFLGTNDKYYATAEKHISAYPDNAILTYGNATYINKQNNHIYAPIENILGLFDTYVYTKETFDPAPRLMQECKYFKKNIIYLRDKNIVDGGSVYWKRECKKPDVLPILNSYEKLYKA